MHQEGMASLEYYCPFMIDNGQPRMLKTGLETTLLTRCVSELNATKRCGIRLYLMSSNLLLMAVPSVLKAAEVFCPAVDSVSEVFLKLEQANRRVSFPHRHTCVSFKHVCINKLTNAH